MRALVTYSARWHGKLGRRAWVSCRLAVSRPPVISTRDVAAINPGSVTAFRYRGRSAKESSFCLDLLQARAHGTKPYGRPQQRIMQNRDDVCRLTASAIEAPHGAPRG